MSFFKVKQHKQTKKKMRKVGKDEYHYNQLVSMLNYPGPNTKSVALSDIRSDYTNMYLKQSK